MGYVPPVLPSGVIYAPNVMSPDEFEQLRRQWYRNVARPPMVLCPPDYGYQQIIGKAPTANRGAPSMDFYHLMNAGLLFSLIALIVAILYAVGLTA